LQSSLTIKKRKHQPLHAKRYGNVSLPMLFFGLYFHRLECDGQQKDHCGRDQILSDILTTKTAKI